MHNPCALQSPIIIDRHIKTYDTYTFFVSPIVNNVQKRICVDVNKCDANQSKPAETQSCESEEDVEASISVPVFKDGEVEVRGGESNSGNFWDWITGNTVASSSDGGPSRFVGLLIVVGIVAVGVFVYKKKWKK